MSVLIGYDPHPYESSVEMTAPVSVLVTYGDRRKPCLVDVDELDVDVGVVVEIRPAAGDDLYREQRN